MSTIMGTNESRNRFGQINVLDLYLFFSLCASFVLWMGLYLINDRFFHNGFFVTTFLVINYFFFIQGVGVTDYLKDTPWFPIFFIGQIILLMGIGFFQQMASGLYLSFIPVGYGIYFFLNKGYVSSGMGHINRGHVNSLGLVLVAVFSYFFFAGWMGGNLLMGKELPLVFSAFIWGIGVIYSGSAHNILKRDEKERFFFHDVINHTHGLNLFLANKISKRVGTSTRETELLLSEIKLMQSLIQSHFGYQHKNLKGMGEYVPFDDSVKRMIRNMVKTFLQDSVKCDIFFKGRIEKVEKVEAEEGVFDLCTIHYPSFLRIVTNLIKNISDTGTKDVEMVFDYNDIGLNFVIRNKIFDLSVEGVDVAKSLRNIILGKKNRRKFKRDGGLGLESITAICREQGGTFHFSLENDWWETRIFLPNPSIMVSSDLDGLKKAA